MYVYILQTNIYDNYIIVIYVNAGKPLLLNSKILNFLQFHLVFNGNNDVFM